MILEVLLALLMLNTASCSELAGHLQRLGNQREKEGHIDVLQELPSPLEFFQKYLKPGRPAVFKGAAKHMPAFKNWDDEYLRTKYANLRMDIEEGKKENRSQASYVYSMKDFVNKYKKEDIYMVHSIQKEMRDDVLLLPILSCGGYVHLLQDIIMWFSSGGTSSVLHNDGFENINCLFSGTKQLYIVDKKYERFVKIDAPQGGHSLVDPDAVDLHKYPGLAKAPWWEAKMEPGDCLYIPYRFYHQVKSFDRNIAVNVWFSHSKHINTTDCEGRDWKDSRLPLTDYPLKSSKGVKHIIGLEVKEKKKMSKKKFLNFIAMNFQIQPNQDQEVVKLVDVNKDNSITFKDIEGLNDKDWETLNKMFAPTYDEGDGGDEGDGYPEGDDGYPEDDVVPEGDEAAIDDGYNDGESDVDKSSDNDFENSPQDKESIHTEL